jgi:2'-5' RNA ligase
VRAFVAVEVPPESVGPTVLPSSNLRHLTLRFLAEVDESTAEGAIAALTADLSTVPTFEFVLSGVGAFPSQERPRVVWRGVGRGAAPLGDLARTVRGAIVRAGVPDDPTPFAPHVTLFRVRSARDRARAALALEPAASPPDLVVAVRSVVFVQSDLRPTGPLHTVRARFPLATPRD